MRAGPGASGREGMPRRDFLRASGGLAASLWLGLRTGGPGRWRRLLRSGAGSPVAVAPWGRIEKVAEGAWALVSTPLDGGPESARTVSNGGIIAGRDGVAVIEGFASEAGARWWAETARGLTGRWPTHVILTHYHGDHSNGLAGYRAEGRTPRYYTTEETREELAAGAGDRASAALETLRGEEVELVGSEPRSLDLGGREVRIVPRAGHTRSDLEVVLEEERLVWCGDLVWNDMFPNYVDATPSVLSRHVRALLDREAEVWVPGHGPIADERALRTYIALLDDVEAGARRAIEAGTPVEEAAEAYRPRGEAGEWVRFSDRYYEVAFRAWERELR